MAKKEEVKAQVAKVARNLQSIDYRKSFNQPILTVDGVFVRPFLTEDKRRGVSIIDVKTGKVLCLAGIGKTDKFYSLTEVSAIQWAKEVNTKQAVTV